MLHSTCALLLSLTLFIGTAAAHTLYDPTANGRQPQPTQQQIDSSWTWSKHRFGPEVDRLYGEIMRAARKQEY
jgi:hypothetical protein